MKKLDDFSTEEVGEEWLRELYKVVARRRYVMYRMIIESTRMLLFGNAGGAALIIGFMGATSRGEEGAVHWLNLLILALFGIGVLTSAITTFLVTMVSVKEAHGSEEGLKKFVDGDFTRNQAMFTIEGRTFYFADMATLTGTVSTLSFLFGGLCSIVMLVLFF